MDDRKNRRGNTPGKSFHGNRNRYSNPMIQDAVDRLFGKCVELVNDGCWKLPDANAWFADTAWKIDDLQKLKEELNETKSNLNDYDLTEWSCHTQMRYTAGKIRWRVRKDIDPELLTQAWCKFYETACNFPLVGQKSLADKKLDSVHLCEAPGAFVTSLNHWLKLNAPDVEWNWLGVTLNPYYEGNSSSRMISDDRLIARTLDNWYFGADNTGNLMNLKNLDAIVKRASKSVMLVTADGSIDCSDTPAEQEEVVSQLLYCQVVAALNLLQKDGNFMLKVFTIFEHQTICLIYLLSCCFEKVFVKKPVTSKEGNSEVYVVCLKFVGSDSLAPYESMLRDNYEKSSEMAMFRLSDIPESFIRQIVDCSTFFKSHQCDVITNNMRTFGGHCNGEYDDKVDLDVTKNLIAKRWNERCNLRPLLCETLEIVGKSKLVHFNITAMELRAPLDSFNVRQDRKNFTPKERLSMIVDKLGLVDLPNTDNTFRLNHIPDEFWITTGKPYARIKSSKFCSIAMMKKYNEAFDIVDEIGFDEAIPTRQSIEEFDRQNHDCKIVEFGYTSVSNSHELIKRLWDALTIIENNQNLILIGYSLLSQLNVGILHILARNFEVIELLGCVKLGCVIRLKNFEKNEKIVELMRMIYDASMDAIENGEAVLTVLPLSWLCDSIMYRQVVNINHWPSGYPVVTLDDSSKRLWKNVKLKQSRPIYPPTAMKLGKVVQCVRNLSSQTQTPKVCIVGAGPAGFYAAQQLIKTSSDVRVDILERLPVPFGLVRFGVAPDHPEVKNVINTFDKTATNSRVNFMGNVNVGKDVTVKQLTDNYHAVLLAYGAEEDKALGIPGENLKNVISGRKFVGWYNGVPDDKNLIIDLDVEDAVIIGQGNVAMDIARILLTPIDQLKKTDITRHALEQLSKSRVRRVHMIGRRGPLQAAFTIAELRELTKLERCKIRWRAEDFCGIHELVETLPRPRKRISELMLKSVEQSSIDDRDWDKELLPIFFRGPSELLGRDNVEKVRLRVNKLVGDDYTSQKAIATEATEDVNCGLALRSIGYRSISIDDDLPFDSQNGRIVNSSGKVRDNLYAVGWAATGPLGVILSTMTNAFNVSSLVAKELLANETKPGTSGLLNILNDKNVKTVSYEQWKKIDEVECRMGKETGKPREKIVDVDEMLEIAFK